jgi:hypothetical protein
MNIKASIDGKSLTMDPVWPIIPLEVPARRVESTLPAGFRVGWVEADSNDPESSWSSFTLTAGAGVGSPWLLFTVTMRDGSARCEAVDMRDVLESWLNRVIEAGPTPCE